MKKKRPSFLSMYEKLLKTHKYCIVINIILVVALLIVTTISYPRFLKTKGSTSGIGFSTPTAPVPVLVAGSGAYVKWEVEGEGQDTLGIYLASNIGDLNGDGKSEVGASAYTSDPGGVSNAGSAFVYDGATGAVLYRKNGEAADDYFGIINGAGDVNNDGTPDFIISAIHADPDGMLSAGKVYVYSGVDGSLLYQKNGAVAGDYFGFSVSGNVDINNDGYDDFIVGGYGADPGGLSAAGSVYVYSGIDGALLYQKNGDTISDNFGYNVDGAGDVNNDGYDDFIVGAPYNDPGTPVRTNAGSAYVYSGIDGALLYQKDGVLASDFFGGTVSNLGDLNNDSYDEFIVGAQTANPGTPARADAGSAFVYSGIDGSLLYQKDGAVGGVRFGCTVSDAGDVNGDGRVDFAVSAYRTYQVPPVYSGSAYIYSGTDGSLIYEVKDSTPGTDRRFGISIASAGDIDGDGDGDIIVGGHYAVNAAVIAQAGKAWIIISDFTAPTITDNQSSTAWYSTDPGAVFDVDFADSSGSFLNNVQYTVWTGAGMTGSEEVGWTNIATGINAATYTSNWAVAFDSLGVGANYVSVRAYDNAGNVSTVSTDIFTINIETMAPTVTDNQADNNPLTSNPGAVFNVDFADTGDSLLNNVQYTAWTGAGMTGTERIGWTNITTGINSASYTTNWGVAFSSLAQGINYISVRAYDNAGNVSTTTTDVFYIDRSENIPVADVTTGAIDLTTTVTEVIAPEVGITVAGVPGVSIEQTIGDQVVEITKALELQSFTSDTIELVSPTLPEATRPALEIPNGTIVYSNDNWGTDGLAGEILPPQAPDTVTAGAVLPGFSIGNEADVFVMGSSNTVLIFSAPVTITFPGASGIPMAYKPAGSSDWYLISTQCAGTYASPTAPTFPGECYIDNPATNEKKLLTYHLTQFARLSYTLPGTYVPPVEAPAENITEPPTTETPPANTPEPVIEPAPITTTGNTLSEVQSSPIPPFNPVWGVGYSKDGHEGRVNWALEHRYNIYQSYIDILSRRPASKEVNWWLTQSDDIWTIRWYFLNSEEYRKK
jgi:hypothetical protein